MNVSRCALLSRQVVLSRRIASAAAIRLNQAQFLVAPPKKSPRRTFAAARTDPESAADARIRQSETDSRIPGTESLETVPQNIKNRNYILAASLFTFCGWVCWYSMQAVGKSDGSAFEQEALEARKQKKQDDKDYSELDMGISDKDIEDGMSLAIAAPDDVASQEEAKNRAAAMNKKKGDSSVRPLWKKIVFFWRVA